MIELTYEPETFERAGMTAVWDKTPLSQSPILVLQAPTKEHWIYVDLRLWQCMRRLGIKPALRLHSYFGTLFFRKGV